MPASLFDVNRILTEELEEKLGMLSESTQTESELASEPSVNESLCNFCLKLYGLSLKVTSALLPETSASCDSIPEPSTSNVTKCCVCDKEAQSHACVSCDKKCHPFPPCGTALQERYGGAVLCSVCENTQKRKRLSDAVSTRQDLQVHKSHCSKRYVSNGQFSG